jgi:hypothetical protein
MLRKTLFGLAMSLLLPVVIAQQSAPAFTSKDLIGAWVSSGIENYGQFFGKREFFLTEKAWALRFYAFSDEKAANPLWTLRVEGTYLLGQSHPSVPGARYADFAGSAKYITAYTPDFLKLYGGGAPWKAGVEYDFSRTGAGFLPSVENGPIEYDLVKLEGSKLYLGDRSIDLNKERAQKPSAYALVRR